MHLQAFLFTATPGIHPQRLWPYLRESDQRASCPAASRVEELHPRTRGAPGSRFSWPRPLVEMEFFAHACVLTVSESPGRPAHVHRVDLRKYVKGKLKEKKEAFGRIFERIVFLSILTWF